MTNLEIDRKLAEAMGLKITSLVSDFVYIKKRNGFLPFSPTTDIRDSWKAADYVGFKCLSKNKFGKYDAYLGKVTDIHQGQAETPQLAISIAALKVIEGSKNDGKRL